MTALVVFTRLAHTGLLRNRVSKISVLLSVLMLLSSGCGQKGPLIAPDPEDIQSHVLDLPEEK